MIDKWKEAIGGRIATKNHLGFMFIDIAGSTPAFLEYTKKCHGTVIDVGCAYGVATLPALEQSTAHVIAFDAAAEHLTVLKNMVKPEDIDRITFKHGYLQQDFNYPENTIDAIHLSYVIPYLSPTDFTHGIHACYQALKPGGKLFINTVSIYLNIFKHLTEDYEEQLTAGATWPGVVEKIKESQLNQSDSKHVPDILNLVTLEFLEKQLIHLGFKIEQSFYYDFKNLPEFHSEGRGCIAIIASK